MTQWEFSHIPFEGDSADDRIVCQKCGWSWKVKDGGNDLYICHKCGFDNQSAYSNFIDPTLIIKGVGEISKGVGSVAQARATKESSKIDVQKQLDARCGKKKKGKNKKEYNSCKERVLSTLDAQARQDFEEKQKQVEFQRKAFAETQKNQRNTTFIVVGLFAVILGIAVYKKFKR
jgi:DNA-directed RNA polymerase subunit RPC12/RpoP